MSAQVQLFQELSLNKMYHCSLIFKKELSDEVTLDSQVQDMTQLKVLKSLEDTLFLAYICLLFS